MVSCRENGAKLCFPSGLSLLFLVVGFAVCPSVSDIGGGMRNILLHPATTDFDSFCRTGNMGGSLQRCHKP